MADKPEVKEVSGKKGGKFSGKRRMLNGKEVKTVFYDGRHAGHGRYFAGYTVEQSKPVSESMILDANKRPLPYSQIGAVE